MGAGIGDFSERAKPPGFFEAAQFRDLFDAPVRSALHDRLGEFGTFAGTYVECQVDLLVRLLNPLRRHLGQIKAVRAKKPKQAVGRLSYPCWKKSSSQLLIGDVNQLSFTGWFFDTLNGNVPDKVCGGHSKPQSDTSTRRLRFRDDVDKPSASVKPIDRSSNIVHSERLPGLQNGKFVGQIFWIKILLGRKNFNGGNILTFKTVFLSTDKDLKKCQEQREQNQMACLTLMAKRTHSNPGAVTIECMTPDERERYSRQILFNKLGEPGQARLLKSRVAIAGCGALGSFHAAVLARAGVGHLTLIDRDYVELSNLQRQWLYTEAHAESAIPKAIAAAEAIRAFASDCQVTAVAEDLTSLNIHDLLADADVILDGTDNFETRYLINDFAVQQGIPWIYGAAVGSYGLMMSVVPGKTACLSCLYPAAPLGLQQTCETAGVLGALTSLIASLQSAAAMRILTGDSPAQVITTADVWTCELRQIPQGDPDPDCRTCGRREFPHLDTRHRIPISLCGRNAVQIHERSRQVDLLALRERLEIVGKVRANEFALRFFLEPYEMTVFPDGRTIVKGTQDIAIARGLYARYIGA